MKKKLKAIFLCLSCAWIALAQVAGQEQLKVDRLPLGVDGQRVLEIKGKPLRKKSSLTPPAEDWSYSVGGAVLERSPRGSLVVKCAVGNSLSDGHGTLVKKGDPLSKATVALARYGKIEIVRGSGPDRAMATGTLTLTDRTLRLDLLNDLVTGVYLQSKDYVEVRRWTGNGE